MHVPVNSVRAKGALLKSLFLFLSLTIIVCPVFAQFAQQQQGTNNTTANKRLKKAADKLMTNPNSGKLHLEVAKAYFQRGSEGDAQRVNRHLRRAVAINPSLGNEATRFLNTAQAGFRPEERSNEERVLDDQLESTLPTEEYKDPDAVIKNGLAQRMARREFRQPSEEFDENKEEVKNLFGLGREDRSEERDWEERLAEVAETNAALGGWRSAFRRALLQAARQTNEMRSTESRFNTGEMTNADEEAEEGEEPDPVQLKNEAFLLYMKGEMRPCREKLIETVAASESLQVRRAAASMSWSGGSVEINPPSSDNGGTSGGLGGAVGPGTSGMNAQPGSTPGQTGNVQDAGQQIAALPTGGTGGQGGQQRGTGVGGGNLPPGMNRQIADTALESLEALGNKEVPPEEAGTKITELGAIGTVGEPLIIDIDENGEANIESTLIPDNKFAANAVHFDLDGDGHIEQVEWVTGGDGLLAVDLDEDGLITSGRELFGTALGHRNGFEALQRFDINGNGFIEGKETTVLLIWLDDGDGVCKRHEIKSLEDLDITSISCRPSGLVSQVERKGRFIKCWEWLPEMRP